MPSRDIRASITCDDLSAPYVVRTIRALPGGDSEVRDVVRLMSFASAVETAERFATEFYDEGDFAVAVFVVDRCGAAVHRGRGDDNSHESDSGRVRRIA